jgi:hypothetical protein
LRTLLARERLFAGYGLDRALGSPPGTASALAITREPSQANAGAAAANTRASAAQPGQTVIAGPDQAPVTAQTADLPASTGHDA